MHWCLALVHASAGGEAVLHPGADALEGVGRRGEHLVDEPVDLAGVADLLDVDAGVAELGGVGPTLVAQEVAAAEDDDRRWQVGV